MLPELLEIQNIQLENCDTVLHMSFLDYYHIRNNAREKHERYCHGFRYTMYQKTLIQ